jgi:hypothetical protein
MEKKGLAFIAVCSVMEDLIANRGSDEIVSSYSSSSLFRSAM